VLERERTVQRMTARIAYTPELLSTTTAPDPLFFHIRKLTRNSDYCCHKTLNLVNRDT
jgi:hypothetical protein